LYKFSQDQIVKTKFFGFLYLDLLKLVVPFIEKDIFFSSNGLKKHFYFFLNLWSEKLCFFY